MQKRIVSMTKSNILVTLQMTCILLLLVLVPVWKLSFYALLIVAAGGLLGSWAVMTMQLNNLSVRPDIKQNARLVKNGPYRLIRHPMYTAVLITMIPLVVDRPTIYNIFIWFVLLITLLYKLNYEEGLLKNHFEEYEDYMHHSWRIIPFIY